MTDNPEAELASLMARYPLSPESGTPELFTEAVQIHGVCLRVAGIATIVSGECITGSAGSMADSPLFRAYLELIERLAVVGAIAERDAALPTWNRAGLRRPTRARDVLFPQTRIGSAFCWSRSSGVAVGDAWSDATRRARYELIERDRVLRSWYGESPPRRVASGDSIPVELCIAYEFEAYELGSSDDTVAVGVFGFPRNAEPLVYGFAARSSLHEATASATAECLQRLAFLWGEAVPANTPVALPTPDFHQEFYLYPEHHQRIRRWLRGDHCSYRGILEASHDVAEPDYVDLTPDRLRSSLRIAKAIPAGHVPLTFGRSHPLLRSEVPEEVAVHPMA